MDVKISVVLPVYNVADYLRKCLDSLVNQTFKDFEVICVNDGSTDLSLSILEGYAINDSRFKIITQDNKGLSGARNTGIKYVQGDYVLFVDSDDWLEENALEELYDHVKGFNSDITMFKFKYFNEDTKEFSESPYTNLEIIPDSFTTSNFNYNDVLDILFKISHAPFNKLYKKSFLDGCSFPEGLIYEDLYFFYTVFLNAKKTSVIRKVLYNYRIRDDSISTKGDEKSFDIFKVLMHVQNNLFEKGIYESVKQDFLMFIIVNLKFVYLRLNEEFKDRFIDLIKEKYGEFNLGDVEGFDGWHYEDQSFYNSICISRNSEIFNLNYEKFQYEILLKHYKTLSETLQVENNNLKTQLEEKTVKKSRFRDIVKL
ncbi:MAG: glycosyltransferase family 2 protein [Methanobrevibacter sp.]|uniref:glycosyltransferase family 2 protein n=1 Tax=Methanobrevibacter sp. TaxID=66852 RepID=UPI0025CD7EB8|nr:glycosyltransferase family 2 protein [Methanobrevibacter sp.]MBR0270965.1 glycosyltransferase family 2 protein [Methanobrevibacter sp.]